MESELFCEDYWTPKWVVSDPGDEVESVFDYFTRHPASAAVASDYLDTTDEE